MKILSVLFVVGLTLVQFQSQAAVQENRDRGDVGKSLGQKAGGIFKSKEKRAKENKEQYEAQLGRILIAQCDKPGAGKDARAKILSCTQYTMWQLAGPSIEASIDDRVQINGKAFARKQLKFVMGEDPAVTKKAAAKKPANNGGGGSPVAITPGGSGFPIPGIPGGGGIPGVPNGGNGGNPFGGGGQPKINPGYNFVDGTIVIVSKEVAAKLGKDAPRVFDFRSDTTAPIDPVRTSTYEKLYEAVSAL